MSTPKNSATITIYEELATISGHMLCAAQQQDWNRLVSLQQGCAQCMERIKGCESEPYFYRDIRQQKIALLKRILSNDRQVRNLTEPAMLHFSLWSRQVAAGCTLLRPRDSE